MKTLLQSSWKYFLSFRMPGLCTSYIMFSPLWHLSFQYLVFQISLKGSGLVLSFLIIFEQEFLNNAHSRLQHFLIVIILLFMLKLLVYFVNIFMVAFYFITINIFYDSHEIVLFFFFFPDLWVGFTFSINSPASAYECPRSASTT